MRMARSAARPRKTPTNVSIRADLVERAKRLGINLSGLFEDALEQAIRAAEARAWQEENAEAIDAYNKWVAKHGSFSDLYRKF